MKLIEKDIFWQGQLDVGIWVKKSSAPTGLGQNVFSYKPPYDQPRRLGVMVPLENKKTTNLFLMVSVGAFDSLRSWYIQLAFLTGLFVIITVLQWQLVHIAWHKRQQRLQHEYDARHDPLTGLSNRRDFDEWAGHACRQAQRYGGELSVLALDLDFFKQINDLWGHDAGDKVLVETANSLVKTLRDCDVIARFGGEEFVIGLPETSLADATNIAERIRTCIQDLNVAVGTTEHVQFTLSIGVAIRRANETNLLGALHRADLALYKAKHSGRNRVCVDDCDDVGNIK